MLISVVDFLKSMQGFSDQKCHLGKNSIHFPMFLLSVIAIIFVCMKAHVVTGCANSSLTVINISCLEVSYSSESVKQHIRDFTRQLECIQSQTSASIPHYIEGLK